MFSLRRDAAKFLPGAFFNVLNLPWYGGMSAYSPVDFD